LLFQNQWCAGSQNQQKHYGGAKMTKEITKEALALKKLREIKSLTRKQAAVLIGVNFKTVEKFENGRTILTRSKVEKIISHYDFFYSDFALCCEGKAEQVKTRFVTNRPQVICNNHLRRSYKKLITKEVMVLTVLRKLKGFTCYQASRECGYSKCTIGHIENGRIELSPERISHIVESYGFTIKNFEHHMKSDSLITDIQDDCISIIKNLSEEKLKAVYPLLSTFKN
jgi:transcriptional regulator with XRE-family HTH domain